MRFLLFLTLFSYSFLTNAQSIKYLNSNLKIEKILKKKYFKGTSSKDSISIFKRTIKIGVIDTGINVENPLFQTRYSASVNSNILKDENGHGTHVQGIIKLLSDKEFLDIFSYKFYNEFNTGKENLEASLVALEKAINDNVDIINYSGGGIDPVDREYELLKKANQKGIIVIVAAGNERDNLDSYYNGYYPAKYKLPNIISVANYSKKGRLARTSNYGVNTVSLGTYGVSVPSLCHYYSEKPCYMTGTSMATPVITSAVARIIQRYPYLQLNEIKHILKINSHKDHYTKYGFFDYASFNLWMEEDFTSKDFNRSNLDQAKMLVDYPEVFFKETFFYNKISNLENKKILDYISKINYNN